MKNKFKTEEKRNPRLVSLTLAVHLKEKVNVPDVLQTPADPADQHDDRPSPTASPRLTDLGQTKTGGESETVVVKDDQSEDDKEVHIEGALSESSEEGDSDDSMLLQDLL